MPALRYTTQHDSFYFLLIAVSGSVLRVTASVGILANIKMRKFGVGGEFYIEGRLSGWNGLYLSLCNYGMNCKFETGSGKIVMIQKAPLGATYL